MPMSRDDLAGWLKFARETGDRGESDAVGAILALDARNREMRDLLRRLVAAGINWEFGGELRTEVEALVAGYEDEERAS